MGVRLRRLLCLPALCLFVRPCAAQDTTPEANPARPTVTNPATLTLVGYLQFEQGYLGSFRSPETWSQNGVNQVIKLAVHPRLMLQLASQPFAVSHAADGDAASHDAGDLLAGAQVVLYPSADDASLPTVSFGYLERVHAGTAPDIDLGGQRRTGLLLFSGNVPRPKFHYDINLIASEQTTDADARRAQFGETLSVNRSFWAKDLQFALELYHFSQPTVDATADGVPVTHAGLLGLLFAPSYNLRPNLVLDGGFEHGFTSTSTRWQAFAGFTWLCPKPLWHPHQ